MKKRLSAVILLCLVLLGLCACGRMRGSRFSIRFLDVGQGDSALVECDGHYMLIDCGNKSAGAKVYEVLKEEGVKKLDILALSHFHNDHVGGGEAALKYASPGLIICNSKEQLIDGYPGYIHKGTSIAQPAVGDVYTLGSAKIEVIYTDNAEENDSMVLMITYGNTRFLLTGDIEEKAQTEITNRYHEEVRDWLEDVPCKIDLIKMPHHGSYTGTLYSFLNTFLPDYCVISVGAGNGYGHPDAKTLSLLSDSKTWQPKVFRTDLNGDILAESDGKTIRITMKKQ